MDTSSKLKCLLIAPLSFYSYSDYLKKCLIDLGYEVVLCNDEYPVGLVGKLMGKLQIPLSLKISRKTIIDNFLRGESYDLILIIKGRGLSDELIDALKDTSPKVIGYTFDSFKYHSAPLKWYNKLTRFYTFDYRDSRENNIEIVELFSSLPDSTERKNRTTEISAIVRNHSGRLKYIDDVLKCLNNKDRFIYIYEQNLLTCLQNFIRSPLLYVKYWKFIFFKPLSYDKYVKVLRESNFTIDYAHPSQSGITIRSFEALSCQTKIITNNPYNGEFISFNNSNSILFSGPSDADFLLESYNKIVDNIPIRVNRTVKDFIKQLIS